MKQTVTFNLTLLSTLLLAPLAALHAADTQLTDPKLTLMKWTIDGVEREAAVHVPESAPGKLEPLVFAFGGARSSMNSASQALPFHVQWPEAMVVYMQPLASPRFGISKKDGRPITAWQHDVPEDGGRDLKFFDAVVTTLRKDYPIDARRIYAFGHSNGGVFSYLLWHTRGEVFAAVATCAAQLRTRSYLHPESPAADLSSLLSPKPRMHVAGREDPIASFEAQSAMVDFVRKINGCDEKSKPWGNELCAEFPGKAGASVVTYFHPGAHELPKDALPLIVTFFKEHPKL